MTNAKASLRILLLFIIVFFSTKINAQVQGLTMGAPPGNIPFGNPPFGITLNPSWNFNTQSATLVLTYEKTKVTYIGTTAPTSCMTSFNNSALGVVTFTMSNLSNCSNSGSIAFLANFQFICPDSCINAVKTSWFRGTITDNNNVMKKDSCFANGILNKNVSLQNSFSSYNSLTAEVTYRISYDNLNCFKIKNSFFNVGLTQGTIVAAYGNNYNYSFTPTTITPSDGLINARQNDVVYYVVKLNCGTPTGTIHTSAVRLYGDSCGTNILITGPANGTYTIPSVPPAATPVINVTQSVSNTLFNTTITNGGNTPLNLIVTSRIPAVHITQTAQYTNQNGISSSIEYLDCNLANTGPYPLIGSSAVNLNVPTTNTRRTIYKVYNLQPGKYVQFLTYYNTTSSCNGPAGNAPFTDSIRIEYNCTAPPTACLPCGPGSVLDTTLVYNPSPVIPCDSMVYNLNFNNIGDSGRLIFKFKNNGDGPLLAGLYHVSLPSGYTVIPGSELYSGFSSNPTRTPNTADFNLPTIPVGTTVYRIEFKVQLGAGATAGSYNVSNTLSGTGYYNNLCHTSIITSGYASIDIRKKVKGNQNTQYGTSALGEAGFLVDYELTLFNSGTYPLDTLIVIDRIPKPGNVRIGTGASISNAFAMQMQQVNPNPSYSVQYTPVQNVCTYWNATAGNCNPGIWSNTLASGGVKFKFNPGYTLAPGDSVKVYFQTLIPAGTGNGLVDCNTAGFSAYFGGVQIDPTESNEACITVQNPCNTNVNPAFTPAYSCVNNIYTVSANSTFGSPANHQWSLMHMSNCPGIPNDATAVQVGSTQTTQNASFIVPTGSNCYYIKHRMYVVGCYDTTFRLQITVPSASIAFNMQDSIGNVKTSFCLGEDVIFNGSASTGESQFTVEIKRRPIGTSIFTAFASFSYTGQASTLNLSQLLLGQGLYLETQYQYSVVFSISNPANCIGTMATKGIFNIVCCNGFFDAGFHMDVSSAPGSYTIISNWFNMYATANATHEWYVLSSPNPVGGPYNPEYSTTATILVWPGAQYDVFYTVIHKVITSCGEVCTTRSQWQTGSKSVSEEIDGCCLAAFYWANGPGNPPAPMSADFDISINSSGNAYYTISVSPTNTYSNLNGVTHEWYLYSSPNAFGGPYTPVSQGNYPNFAFNGAEDALYYFIVHKVITPCGEVCFTQDICRNCGEKKACDIKWPDCYPPINLKNNCRRNLLSWDPVSAAGGYEIQLSYNDPECCNSEYLPVVKNYILTGNVFDLAEYNHPKFDCIRWRVRAKCKDGYSEWSSWLCFYCTEIISPDFPLKGNKAGDMNAVKPRPEITPQVLPNPNNGSMFLRMKTKGELTLSVQVFNASGVLVTTIRENKYPDGNFTKSLNLGSGVPKGLYLVVFRTNFGTYTEKVIVN